MTAEKTANGQLVAKIISATETKTNGTTQKTAYEYDAINRLIRTVHPGGGVDTYTYDVRKEPLDDGTKCE